jgi:hypothetical protein
MEEGFSYKGKTLLSRIDPAGKADRIADSVQIIDATLYLCPSPLFGYGLERLLSRLEELAPNSAVLCIEPEPELFAISSGRFSEKLKQNQKLSLTDRCEAAELCALIRKKWGSRIFRGVELLRLNGGWQLFPALNELLDTLRREIALDWGNAMTLAKLGRRYIRNAIRNLALIPGNPSIAELSFGAQPALVLGAGPSLDPLLDVLIARFGEVCLLPETRPFRIICVDTCLPALRQRDIKPDLAIILESQHWNLEDFSGLSGWDVPAAFDLSALPRSASVLGNRLFLFFTPWTQLNIFNRLEAAGLLPPGMVPLGSVGLNAVAVSLRLTQGPIITAGLDFSFNMDASHARSTPEHLKRLRRQNRLNGLINTDAAFGNSVFRTVSKRGEPVFTNPGMRNYRDQFENEFGCLSSRLFDLEGNGLHLGVKSLSMDEGIGLLISNNNMVNKRKFNEKITLTKENITLLTNTSYLVNKKNNENNQSRENKLRDFKLAEIKRLNLLLDILTGKTPMDYNTLAAYINECDYLWAHFPDYAASSRRPDKAWLEAGGQAVVSFLNRLRVEIDPFLKLW